MKTSIYTYESNALIATISRGVKTKFDWLLEVETKCGGKLISAHLDRNLFLTKREAVNQFKRILGNQFLIREVH